MNGKQNTSASLTIAGLIAYIGTSGLGEEWRVGLTIGLTLLMVALNRMAQRRNPDGTSAKAPWAE